VIRAPQPQPQPQQQQQQQQVTSRSNDAFILAVVLLLVALLARKFLGSA